MSSEPSPSPGLGTKLRSLAGRFFQAMGRGARAVRRYFAAVAAFYWGHRRAFKEYLTEFTVGLQSLPVRRREIRLSAHQRLANAWRADDGWHVELPDCCVVCGRPTGREWITVAHPVLDVALPFWSPAAGLGLGFVLLLATRWFWMWPLGFLAGFIFGYEYRHSETAAVRFRRCEEHADAIAIPHLRRFKELLIVRVGHQRVRKLFFQGQERGASYLAAMEPPPVELPTMPLEEDADGTAIDRDDRPRMKGYPGPVENLPQRGASDAAAAGSPPAQSSKLRAFEPEHTLKTNEDPVWGPTIPLAGEDDERGTDAQGSDEEKAT